MIISSWNVNSVRARIENIKSYLLKYKPDIVMMQEIKTPNETYPYDDFKSLSAFNVGSIILFKIFFSSSSFIKLDGE